MVGNGVPGIYIYIRIYIYIFVLIIILSSSWFSFWKASISVHLQSSAFWRLALSGSRMLIKLLASKTKLHKWKFWIFSFSTASWNFFKHPKKKHKINHKPTMAMWQSWCFFNLQLKQGYRALCLTLKDVEGMQSIIRFHPWKILSRALMSQAAIWHIHKRMVVSSKRKNLSMFSCHLILRSYCSHL